MSFPPPPPPSSPPSGPAGGDLSGTYPNPSVAKINGTALGTLSGAATANFLEWNGTAWAPANPPGTQIAYAQKTTDTSVTATTAATANAVATSGSVTCDGAAVMVQLFAASVARGTSYTRGVLFVDGALVQDQVFAYTAANGSSVSGWLQYTPSAGAHTFGFNSYVDGGTGTIGATSIPPAFIRVTKI